MIWPFHLLIKRKMLLDKLCAHGNSRKRYFYAFGVIGIAYPTYPRESVPYRLHGV